MKPIRKRSRNLRFRINTDLPSSVGGGRHPQETTLSFLIRKDRQPNTENPLKLNLSGVIVKHLPYRG